MFHLLLLRTFLTLKKTQAQNNEDPPISPVGASPGSDMLGELFFSDKKDFLKERYFKTPYRNFQ